MLNTSNKSGRITAANRFSANLGTPHRIREGGLDSRAFSYSFVFKGYRPMKYVVSAIAVLLVSSQSACAVIGYSGGGGWFVWPGGLGLIVLIIAIVLLVRRRR